MPHTYRRRRSALTLAGAAAIALGLLTFAGCARPGGLASGGAPPNGHASGSETTSDPASGIGATSTPATHSTTPASPPPARSGATACTAADLTFVGSTTGGAMGSLITTYSVVNQSRTGCVLQGSPHLKYIAANGSVADVPTTNWAGGDKVTVDPGAAAQFDIREANGFGGYPHDSPACAHPASYSGLSAVLADGSTAPLGGSQLSVQCGEIDVNVWHRPAA